MKCQSSTLKCWKWYSTHWFVYTTDEVFWGAVACDYLSNNPTIINNGFLAAHIPQSIDAGEPMLGDVSDEDSEVDDSDSEVGDSEDENSDSDDEDI